MCPAAIVMSCPLFEDAFMLELNPKLLRRTGQASENTDSVSDQQHVPTPGLQHSQAQQSSQQQSQRA
jgi:hypothetical protein